MISDEAKRLIAEAEAPAPFVREERYIVIKLKHLDAFQTANLRQKMRDLGIGSVDAVVVEADWPEYEPTWRAIEQRVTEGPAKDAAKRAAAAELDDPPREGMGRDSIKKSTRGEGVNFVD